MSRNTVEWAIPWRRRKPKVVAALLVVWALMLWAATEGWMSILWPLLFTNLIIGVASLRFRGDRDPTTMEIER